MRVPLHRPPGATVASRAPASALFARPALRPAGVAHIGVLLLSLLIAWSAVAEPPPRDQLALLEEIDRQLDRVQTLQPCPFADDAWTVTRSREPPPRIPCPFTAQTFIRTKALWVDAVEHTLKVDLAALRADPQRHVGDAYVLSGRVTAVSHGPAMDSKIRLVLPDGSLGEAVSRAYLTPRRDARVDVVGYLAGVREAALVLAVSSLIGEHEVARAVERWRRAKP